MIDLSTTTFERANAAGFATRDRARSERAFRRARRHSRIVRVLRVAAPIGLLVVLSALILVTWLEPMRLLKTLPGSIDQVAVSGTKITMTAPKLSGFTRDARKYDLSARAATQDITKPDILNLEDITAKFETQDRTQIDLTASTGTFDRKSGMLFLRENVLLNSSNGYQVRLSEVRVNTATSDIFSDDPVQIDMLQGTLKAKRMQVLKTGEVLSFEGGVSMVLIPGSDKQQPQSPDKP